MTATESSGFLTYLGVAIRLELLRGSIELQTGSKETAQMVIVETLRKFKVERGIA